MQSELSKLLRKYIDALEVADIDTVIFVLDISCFDEELSEAIKNWHAEHDEPVQLTEEDKLKIFTMIENAKRRFREEA